MELFEPKPEGSPLICFLGGSAEVAGAGDKMGHQLSDAPGRMSRALPLFLAEQTYFKSEAKVETLVPWVAGESAAFALSGQRQEDEYAAEHARAGEVKGDYVVVIHIDGKVDPWNAEVRLVRAIDAKCLGEASATFPYGQMEDGIAALAGKLISLLAEHAEVRTREAPRYYNVPEAGNFAYYLLRMEQLLAVRCATMEGASASFLSGERDIIDGNIQTCLAAPESVPARLVLMETVAAMKKVRAGVVGEFREKLLLLQKEKPLEGVAQGIAQRVLDEVVG